MAQMDHETLMNMSRDELTQIAMRTRNPRDELSDEMLTRMEQLKAGPFEYDWKILKREMSC